MFKLLFAGAAAFTIACGPSAAIADNSTMTREAALEEVKKAMIARDMIVCSVDDQVSILTFSIDESGAFTSLVSRDGLFNVVEAGSGTFVVAREDATLIFSGSQLTVVDRNGDTSTGVCANLLFDVMDALTEAMTGTGS